MVPASQGQSCQLFLSRDFESSVDGLLTSGAILSRYLAYLSELIESVRRAIRAGQSLEEAIVATPLWQKYTQDATGSNLPLVAQFAALRAGFHRWNVWRTYQGMKGDLA
jgi:hypothetical protein